MTSHTNFKCDIIPNMLPVGHHLYFTGVCHLSDHLILLKPVDTCPFERNDHWFQAWLDWTSCCDLDFQTRTRGF